MKNICRLCIIVLSSVFAIGSGVLPTTQLPVKSSAIDPYPPDGRQYIEPLALSLNWLPPQDNPSPVDHYTLRLDEDPDVVQNPALTPAYAGNVAASPTPSFLIDEMARDTTYYWRVDAVLQDASVVTGDLWSFTTEPIDIPGNVVNYSSDPVNQYLMSPSLIILPDGTYIANHEYGGPWSSGHAKETLIFRSTDQGRSWRQIATVYDQFWSSTFYHNDALYLMGIDGKGGNPSVTIRRSDDGGETWTEALDENSGLLRQGTNEGYHTGPVPIAIHNGRIWRGMEDRADPGEWGYHFRAFVMSAPVDADLLVAANWTATPPMSHDEINWTGTGWLEGNVVVSPAGEMLNILRVSSAIPSLGTVDTAAVMHVSDDGTTASFDPDNDFIDLPGGGVKFVIRYDEESELYWTLSNYQRHPYAMRNKLTLCSSPDLRQWTAHETVLYHWDFVFHAWQYVDWRIDGEDIVFVSRTAYPMGHEVLPHGYHDANFFTFHRIENFRDVLAPLDDDTTDDDTVDDDTVDDDIVDDDATDDDTDDDFVDDDDSIDDDIDDDISDDDATDDDAPDDDTTDGDATDDDDDDDDHSDGCGC